MVDKDKIMRDLSAISCTLKGSKWEGQCTFKIKLSGYKFEGLIRILVS